MPSNIVVQDKKPNGFTVLDTKPSSSIVILPTQVFTETRVINIGQPVPWGLNWLITYPVAGTFTGVRI